MEIKKNPFRVLEQTDFEKNDLEKLEKEVNAEEYHAVECTCLGLQMVDVAKIKNVVTGQTDHMIAVNVQVAIPLAPEKIQGGVLTPDGLGRKFQEACPVAPVLRILIKDDYLLDGYKPIDLPMEDFNNLLSSISIDPK